MGLKTNLEIVTSGMIDFPLHLVSTESHFLGEDREIGKSVDIFLHKLSADMYLCNTYQRASKAKVLAMAYAVRKALMEKRGYGRLETMLKSIRLTKHIKRGYKKKQRFGIKRSEVVSFFDEARDRMRKIKLPRLILDKRRARTLFGTQLPSKE